MNNVPARKIDTVVSIHNTGHEYMVRDAGDKNIKSFPTLRLAIDFCRANGWFYTYDH